MTGCSDCYNDYDNDINTAVTTHLAQVLLVCIVLTECCRSVSQRPALQRIDRPAAVELSLARSLGSSLPIQPYRCPNPSCASIHVCLCIVCACVHVRVRVCVCVHACVRTLPSTAIPLVLGEAMQHTVTKLAPHCSTLSPSWHRTAAHCDLAGTALQCTVTAPAPHRSTTLTQRLPGQTQAVAVWCHRSR